MNTSLFRILCVLAFLLNLAACTSSNNVDNTGTSTTADPVIDPDADPDLSLDLQW